MSKKETKMCVFENLICEVKTAVYIKYIFIIVPSRSMKTVINYTIQST